ncbi:MAG: hypothetical protein JRN15_21675, partial [Nitrososphaerota archaeon]|nr:hypothetical protein [Nitrososphaerota archaeon]
MQLTTNQNGGTMIQMYIVMTGMVLQLTSIVILCAINHKIAAERDSLKDKLKKCPALPCPTLPCPALPTAGSLPDTLAGSLQRGRSLHWAAS